MSLRRCLAGALMLDERDAAAEVVGRELARSFEQWILEQIIAGRSVLTMENDDE